MDYQSFLIFLMELVGTVAFASSGAMTAIGRKMDIFGVGVLGVVTACGGGMIRDVILGVIPPNVFVHAVYAQVAIIVSSVTFLLFYWKGGLIKGRIRSHYDKAILIMDTLGLAVFTVVGVNTGMSCGYEENEFLLVFVGTITGVGGGLLRDMMAGVPPYIFVKHIYACASIVGAFVCVLLHRRVGNVEAMAGAGVVVIGIRYLAVRYRWNLPKLPTDKEREK